MSSQFSSNAETPQPRVGMPWASGSTGIQVMQGTMISRASRHLTQDIPYCGRIRARLRIGGQTVPSLSLFRSIAGTTTLGSSYARIRDFPGPAPTGRFGGPEREQDLKCPGSTTRSTT